MCRGREKKKKARRENSDLYFSMGVLIVAKADLPCPFPFLLS
jgi:hypothetical protein